MRHFTNFMWDVSVPFRHGERIGFSYLVSQKYTGDNAAIKVLRNCEILTFDIKLATHKRLIPAHVKGRPPSYYIIAGFVFTTVSVPYLRSEVCCSTFECLFDDCYFLCECAWTLLPVASTLLVSIVYFF